MTAIMLSLRRTLVQQQSYELLQRIKEIGIRKVLRAAVFNPASLLSKYFLKLFFIANSITFPVAWQATMNGYRDMLTILTQGGGFLQQRHQRCYCIVDSFFSGNESYKDEKICKAMTRMR
jgi:hypothetical protein